MQHKRIRTGFTERLGLVKPIAAAENRKRDILERGCGAE